MKRSASVLGFSLLASCTAAGGESPPALVDGGEEPTIDSAADPSTKPEAVPEADASLDATDDLSNTWDSDLDVQHGYDIANTDPFVINIFDSRGPDGQCLIPPGGPWVGTDPDSGLAYCLFAPDSWQSIVCDCLFSRYFPDGGYVGRDP